MYLVIVLSQQELSKDASAQLVSVTSVVVLMVTSAHLGILAVAKLFRWIANRKRDGLDRECSIN